jgi:hypothetical protein
MHEESIKTFIHCVSEERRDFVNKLHKVIESSLPSGFEVHASNGMLNYVVPLSRYPKGYHATKGGPLPFISIASQKNHIALYHMGLYGNPELMQWFEEAYTQHSSNKLDMGKSCIRFEHLEQIPFDLIGELCQKITVDEYIAQYEAILIR